MEFVCNLQVPRSEAGFGVPTAWIHDPEVGISARGFLWTLLCAASPGKVVVEEDLPGWDHPDNLPIGEVVAELERAGYLVLVGKGRYELVHPARPRTSTGGEG
jgi:hypothetical protein